MAAAPQRLGAHIGFLSILHTWSSNLLGHYHIHCVVPGGGLSADHQRWIPTSHPLFLLPVPVLSTVFREKFLAGMRQPYRRGLLDCRGPAHDFSDPVWFEELMEKLGDKNWYVDACPPFGGPAHVLRYLGRHTHRMAISNHRLTAFDGVRVSFLWRDYAHGNKRRIMTLDAQEFLRRFFLHVLPRGFVCIRHYGLLSNRFRKQLLPLARTLLAARATKICLDPRCRIQTSGTVPAAARPCALFNALPLPSSIWLLSIPHERCRQSAPQACSSQVFAPVCPLHHTRLKNSINGISQALDRRPRIRQLITRQRHRRRSLFPDAFPQPENDIQYP